MKQSLFVTALVCLSLAGCASMGTVDLINPERFSASESKYPGQSTIYIFRGSSGAGAMWSYPITLDGKPVGSIRREQYLAMPAPEGAHWLTVTCPSICEMPGYKINIEAKSDHSYYLMIEPDMVYGYRTVTISSSLTQIPKSFADRLLATYEQGRLAAP
jgi:hypothetical protein